MKKTTKPDDRTNFTIGVSSGFGAMKNRIGFTIIGLLIGLLCGFKWANYNYRDTASAAGREDIAKAAAKVSAQPNEVQQAMESIRKARETPDNFELQRQAA